MPGHLVGLRRGAPRAGVHVGHHQIALLPGIARQHRGRDAHRAAHAELARLAGRGEHRRRGAVDVHRAHQLGVRVGDHLRVHHHLERRLHPVHRLRILRRVLVVLHRDLRELLEGGAVLARVLHARLGEHGRHRAGAEQALLRDALAAAAAAEQARLAELLDADHQHQVVEPGLDRRPALAERRRAGGAGVRAVRDRDSRLPDLLEDALADHPARLHQVAAVERLHVLDLQARVVEREQRRLGAELGNRLGPGSGRT